jgi:hypothetical protein
VSDERPLHSRRGEVWREVDLWTEGPLTCRLFEDAQGRRRRAAAFQVTDDMGRELAFGALYVGGPEVARYIATELAQSFNEKHGAT